LELLPESHAIINQIFSTHADPGEYDLYGTSLYGVSEIIRAAKAPEILANGDFKQFGEFMKISHDGDRISGTSFEKKGETIEFESGSYACSTNRIDALCDLMNSTEGVWGSSLAGAGLGGCVLILVDKNKTEFVMNRLNTEFYDKLGLERSAFVCFPSNGSKVIY
jgi:galactokinase